MEMFRFKRRQVALEFVLGVLSLALLSCAGNPLGGGTDARGDSRIIVTVDVSVRFDVPPVPRNDMRTNTSDVGSDATGGACTAVAPTATTAWSRTDDIDKLCDVDKAISEDGAIAGLARGTDGSARERTFDGHVVTSCIAFDFGEERDVASLRLVARGVNGPVCGVSCSAECNTERKVHVFRESTEPKFVQTVELSGDIASHTINVGQRLQTAVVCRTGAGIFRDHIEVDYLEACVTP